MNAKQNLSRNLIVVIDGNTYNVAYPNIGQLMKIESMKMLYSANTYGSMVRTRTKSSDKILDLIDMVSHFLVLIPTLNEQIIGAKSIDELDLKTVQPFLAVYKTKIQPWLEEWEKALAEPVVIEDDEAEENEKS